MRPFPLALLLAAAAAAPAGAQVRSLDEGFEDFDGLFRAGYVVRNNSEPAGGFEFFPGIAEAFPAHAGTQESYVAANFDNTGPVGTISSWFVTPELDLSGGGTVSFFTRTTFGLYPDRLQVRLSRGGASDNVGAAATDVGDFSTLLLDINPTYRPGAAGYPLEWTQYTLSIPAGADGRVGFRYFVEDAGEFAPNAAYIGIDTLTFTPVPEPAGVLLLAAAGAAAVRRLRRRFAVA